MSSHNTHFLKIRKIEPILKKRNLKNYNKWITKVQTNVLYSHKEENTTFDDRTVTDITYKKTARYLTNVLNFLYF